MHSDLIVVPHNDHHTIVCKIPRPIYILINTIVPMKMAYMDLVGSGSKDYLVELMRSIKSEKNSILRKFNKLRQMHPDALESQALVELKIEYCDKNKCLDCEIGNYLLNRNM